MKKALCKITVLLMVLCLAATSAPAMPSYNDVLLVVNIQSPESMEIGAYFKTARNLPDANICRISIRAGVDGARMSNHEQRVALAVIKRHLAINHLTDKINYIVLTRGIPYWAYTGEKGPFAWDGTIIDGYHLFDIFLMYQLSDAAGDSKLDNIFNNNPYFYYNNDMLARKFSRKQFGYYLVSRLDGGGLVNVKNMIDSSGAPACESYKKQANGKMKLLTLTPYYDQTFADEINSRGNIEVVSPNPLPPDVWDPDTKKTTLADIGTAAAGQMTTTFDKVGKDVMFSYLNDVAWNSFFPWPEGNSYYSDADFVTDYPFIYRGATFLPGSIMMTYRSAAATYMFHSGAGGLSKMKISTKAKHDYQKADGSDIKFRHMTCAAYDPVNKQVWCGTGASQLDVAINFDQRCTDEVHRETMLNYGGGIAIYDADTGAIISHINANTAGSPLKNNRVVKLVYDKNSKYMWLAHYKGIQYYDLTAKTWNDIPALQCDYAAAADICLDSFDSDKVYFSFYYNPSNVYPFPLKVSSQLTGADTSIFEYSKSAKTVTPYVIDPDKQGILPKMAKTSANTIWVSKDTMLYRYNLTTKTVLEKIDLNTVLPEKVSSPDSITIETPRNFISPAPGIAIVTTGCSITLLNTAGETTFKKKNYLLRISEKTPASTVDVINIDTMNNITNSIHDYKIRDIAADPSANGKILYMALSNPPAVLRSTDAGAKWSAFSTDYSNFNQVNGIALDGNGSIYAARGYKMQQNIAADFQAFGLCAFGGGISNDVMEYIKPQPMVSFSQTGHPYYTGIGSWSSTTGYRGSSQMEPMMFMLLDGFYMGEARLSVFKSYPAQGGGGHNGHMLVFEPKSAPFAPRVNESMIPANPQVINNTTIEIPILSPGLPWHMNDLIMSTVNKDTIQITDDTDAVFTPDKYEFIKPSGPDEPGKVTGTGKLVISGNYTGILYNVKLICGVNGIKNIKGASLTNTRPDEFKDDIMLEFGNGYDISHGTYMPPDQIKMPQTKSRMDLIVNKLWLDTAPAEGIPLTVKFQIKNIGAAKTKAGTIAANIYWNDILVGTVTHGDLAPGKMTAELSFVLDPQYVTAGIKHQILIKADGNDKVVEIRENNNTGSTTFFIENRPDLIVKDISLSSIKAGKATVNFSIANAGYSSTAIGAGAHTASVYINNILVGTVNHDNLAKDAVVSLKLDNVNIKAGACKVKIIADSTNKVTEVSEANNMLEKVFTVLPSSLNVIVKNQTKKHIAWIQFYAQDSLEITPVTPATPLPFSINPGGQAALDLKSANSGRMYVSFDKKLSSDAPDGANTADPDYLTRFDKVEFTYLKDNAGYLGGTANLTAVDFYAIPMILETSIQGITIDHLTLADNTSGNAVAAAITKIITDQKKSPIISNSTETVRVLSPVKDPAGYQSLDPYLNLLNKASLTISGTFFGTSGSSPYNYKCVISKTDINLTTNLNDKGSPVNITMTSLQADKTDLINHNGIYTCNGKFNVTGQVDDNNVSAAVYRDFVAGLNLGFVKNGTDSSKWWGSQPFSGAYFNQYAQAISQTYPGAYGFPFSDTYKHLLADLGGMIDTITVTILDDSTTAPHYTPQGTKNPQKGSLSFNLSIVTSDPDFVKRKFTFNNYQFNGGSTYTFPATLQPSNSPPPSDGLITNVPVPAASGLYYYDFDIQGKSYVIFVNVGNAKNIEWACISGNGANSNWAPGVPNVLFIGGL